MRKIQFQLNENNFKALTDFEMNKIRGGVRPKSRVRTRPKSRDRDILDMES